MTTSLEDILNSGGPAKSAQPAPQVEQPAPPEPEEDDTSSPPAANPGETEPPAPSAAPPAAPAEDSLDKKIAAFQRKAEDETRKRQDYERQLQEARAERDRLLETERQRQAQIAAQQQQQEIDLFDPQQAKAYVNSIIAERDQAVAYSLLEQKVVTSQELMRDRHADYDEMEAIFAEEMEKDPTLQQKMWADSVPARFAYNHAKRVKAMREIGDDPTAFRERIKQEVMAELQAQNAQAAQTVQTPAATVPQPPKTLAGMPSAARNVNKQPWKGPTPLDQLLN